MKIKSALASLEQSFDKSIYDDNEIRTQTRLLMAYIADILTHEVILNFEAELTPEQEQKFSCIIADIKRNRPLQYITGQTWFYHREFYTQEGVLIPRPETEELVALAINDIKTSTISGICDIGCGSGCIAVSLKKEIPDTRVWGVDINEKAIELSKKNAKFHQADIDFFHSDILSPNFTIPLDCNCLISNPPYVLNSEKEIMMPNVLLWEPHSALFVSDDDSLLFYRRIFKLALDNKQVKNVFFELNPLSAENLKKEVLQNTLVEEVFLHKDFQGKIRFMHIKLK